MVSWDMEVKFLGHTPHIKELQKLAKGQGFSNIEQMKQKKVNDDGTSIYWLAVNNRGTEQKEFISEVLK